MVKGGEQICQKRSFSLLTVSMEQCALHHCVGAVYLAFIFLTQDLLYGLPQLLCVVGFYSHFMCTLHVMLHDVVAFEIQRIRTGSFCFMSNVGMQRVQQMTRFHSKVLHSARTLIHSLQCYFDGNAV